MSQQAQYMPVVKLAIESVVFGAVLIAVLHYAFPFAEHPPILNTMGLLMDIIGVVWIAYDIFPYSGPEEYGEEDAKRAGIETPEYKAFKRRHVTNGLRIVVIGFFLQILAYWVEPLRKLLP